MAQVSFSRSLFVSYSINLLVYLAWATFHLVLNSAIVVIWRDSEQTFLIGIDAESERCFSRPVTITIVA